MLKGESLCCTKKHTDELFHFAKARDHALRVGGGFSILKGWGFSNDFFFLLWLPDEPRAPVALGIRMLNTGQIPNPDEPTTDHGLAH